MMHDWNGWGDQNQGWMHGGAAIIGIVIAIALIAIVVIGLIALYRMGRPLASKASPSDPAVETVREAFAKGEINEEEFSKRMALLTKY